MGGDGRNHDVAMLVVGVGRNYDAWPGTLGKTVAIGKRYKHNVSSTKRHRASSSRRIPRLQDSPTLPPTAASQALPTPAAQPLGPLRQGGYQSRPPCPRQGQVAGPAQVFDSGTDPSLESWPLPPRASVIHCIVAPP